MALYQALYRKYRPKSFSDVVGQEHITDILKNQLRSGKIFHAYLFTGSRGTGKTTCAKILAKAVNCLSLLDGDACCECLSCKAIESGDVLDITEIDAASNNGVENIRDLREQVNYTPTSAKYRVYIIDEVHMLSQGAFNALLKTLEEPPKHIIFILATTEVHKLPATILSRCQRFDFKRISADVISNRLLDVASREGFTIEKSAADMIAALSDGGMRDALSTLDLCAARTSNITDDDVLSVCSLAGNNYLLELASYIMKNDCGAALKKIDELHKNAVDLQRLVSELISHYRNLMVAKTVSDPSSLIVCAPKMLEKIVFQAKEYSIEAIVNAISVFTETLDRMTNQNRRTEAETAIVRLCTPELDTSVSALLSRIERIERTLKYSSPAPQKEEQEQETVNEQIIEETIVDEVAPIEEVAEEPIKEAEPVKTQSSEEVFEAWEDVLAELQKSAPLLAATLNGSKAYVKQDLLLIDCANDQFFSLMRSDTPIYRQQIKSAVMTVVGKNFRLGPYKTAEKKTDDDPLQSVIDALEKLQVPKD